MSAVQENSSFSLQQQKQKECPSRKRASRPSCKRVVVQFWEFVVVFWVKSFLVKQVETLTLSAGDELCTIYIPTYIYTYVYTSIGMTKMKKQLDSSITIHMNAYSHIHTYTYYM